MTERENGQYRALQPQSLFASQQFATAVYQSELAYRLRDLGYEITMGKNNAPEIKGYTQEYLDASSPRSQQIRAYLERTGWAGAAAAQIAAHSTRDSKEIHSPAVVMAAHRRLAAEFGYQAEAVVRAARDRQQHLEKSIQSVDRVRESLTFSRDKNFEREAVVDERALIRDGLRRSMGDATYIQIRANLDTRLASGEFQVVQNSVGTPARQFTTAKTIQAEHEILQRVAQGKGQIEPILSRALAIAAADQQPHLNRSQKSVVEDVLSSPDRIQGIQGYAGTGKTTTLSVVRAAAETQGFAVEGFAPTSRAARQLAEAGVEGGTLQGFLARGNHRDEPMKKHFYFVDESSLASTNQMREFLTRLGPHDRVLLIGDTRQHQGVEAGRPFQQLQQAGMRTAHLDEIVRQKDPALKSAVESLAKGDISGALDSLQKQGRIREVSDASERVREIARSYVDAPDRTLIVSPDNASRRELNTAVREELKAKGSLSPADYSFKVLIQRQEMTGAERAWASQYEAGDVIRYSRGSKAMGIEPGSYATVVGVDPLANHLSVQVHSGATATYDARRLAGINVYRATDREFAVGDRIQFTAPDKSLGVANRDLAIIDSIRADGRIFAHLDNGRRIEFDPATHRHFDHGYAVTSHSAQGLTAERVLVNADTGVHPDLLNSRFGYVSISRASHEATLFTDDVEKLSRQIGVEITKTTAIEINHVPSIIQGTRMTF